MLTLLTSPLGRYIGIGLVSALAGFWLAWKIQGATIAGMERDQAVALAKFTDEARKKDAENVKLASDLDQANLEKRDALEKASDSARDVARARGLWVKAGSVKCLPGTSADSSNGESGTASVRLDEQTSNALIAIARDGDRAALYAQTCHQWATQVGR